MYMNIYGTVYILGTDTFYTIFNHLCAFTSSFSIVLQFDKLLFKSYFSQIYHVSINSNKSYV